MGEKAGQPVETGVMAAVRTRHHGKVMEARKKDE